MKLPTLAQRMPWLRAAAMAILASLVALASEARPIEAIRKEGRIVIATEGQFAPFNFFEGAKLTGFEIDVAEALAQRMGLKVEWKTIGFDALLTGLQQDRWDMVIASHGVTEERAKAVTFADPHYCSGGVIVARSAALRSAKDLAGKVVAVQTGTTYLENVKKVAGVKEVKNFPQDNNARAALQSGRVDAWVTDRFLAKTALDADPKAGLVIGDFLFVERIAPAVAKGNQGLAAAVNQALAKLLADGGYAEISKRWFKEDIRCR